MKWLFIAHILFITQYLSAKEIVVCKSCEINDIQTALTKAQNHDRILIKKGVYISKNIVINKSIELIGEDYPIIDGEHKVQVITVGISDVTIKGLIIKNSKSSYTDDIAGIKIENVHNVVVEDCRFYDNFWAVYLAKSDNCKIVNNIIRGSAKRETSSGNGIHLWNCKNALIKNNKISGHRDGIYFEFVENSSIIGNLSEKNIRYGLHFMFSHHNEYLENTFRANGAGVVVMYSKHIKMIGNHFEENWGPAACGLLLKEITDSFVSQNVFYKNTQGILAENSDRIEFKENQFIENGWAVKIGSSCLDDYFYHNNFIGNTFEVATNSTMNNSVFSENYWSDYKGYDLDRDGFGDIPHRPVRLFSYISEKYPQVLILLRSLFVTMLDLTERYMPVFSPETLIDKKPLIRKWIG